MRQRFFWKPAAAGARWPEDVTGQNLPPFNWVKIDNRGANPVLVGLNAQPANDQMDFYAQVSGGKWRCFNVAGPKKDEADGGDSFLEEVHLLAITGGTTVMIEISDTPLVDMGYTI
jgi:hypothetical protein